MARRSTNKKLVMSIVVSAMVAVTAGAVALMSLWRHRDPSVYVQQAVDACRAANLARALGAYARAYRETLDPRWILEGGLTAQSFGNATKALNLFDKAIAARSDYLPAHRSRVVLRTELVRLSPGAEGYANLRKDADALLAIYPKDPRALLARGIALAGLVREDPAYVEESLAAIKQAHELAPKDVEIADALARRYEARTPDASSVSTSDRQEPSAAEAVYQELVDAVSDDGDAWLRYAQFLLRRLKRRQGEADAQGIVLKPGHLERETEDIRRLLTKAAERAPANSEVSLAWAEAWSLFGQPGKSVEVLSQAIESTPDDLRIYVELGRRLLEAGRTSEARTILKRGLDRPFNRESYRGLLDRPRRHALWCMTAESYLQDVVPGSPDAAELIRQAEEARAQADVELTPDHWMGRMLLGQIRRAQRRLQTALNRYLEADRMLEWHDSAADKLGVKLAMAKVQLALEQYGPVQEVLGEILERRPSQPEALAMRAWVDLKLGRTDSAVAFARRAVSGLGRVPAATAPSTTAAANRGQRGLLRQTLRVWWCASLLENQSGTAARAQQRLAPLTADDHVFRAEVSIRYGQTRRSARLLKQGEEAYRAAVRADPTRVDAVRALIALCAGQGRRGDAMPILQEALSACKSQTDGATALAQLEAVRIELDAQIPASQRDAQITAALSKVEDPVRRTDLLADFYLAHDQPAKAAELLDAVESRADDVQWLERRFVAHLALADWEDVKALREQATELDADGAGGALYEGRDYLARGHRHRSEARRLRETDPKLARAHDEDATRYWSAGVDVLRSGADQAVGSSMARVWLARTLVALGREEALSVYRAALLLNPLNADAHRDLAWLGKTKGVADVDVDAHLDEAVWLARKGLDGLPADAWLHAQAEDLYEQDHPAESIKRREFVRQAKPGDADNLLRLGLLYRQTGKKEKAAECLRQALAAAPRDIQVHRRVSELYRQEKREEDAIRLLEGLASRLRGPERTEALLLLAKHLRQMMVDLQANDAPAGKIRALRDRADRVFEQAAAADAVPSLCQAAADFCLLTERRAEAVRWLRRSLRGLQDTYGERPIREKLIRTMLEMRPLPKDLEQEIADYDAHFFGQEEVSLFWGMFEAAKGKLEEARRRFTRYLDRLHSAKSASHIRPDQLAEAYYYRGQLYLRLAAVRLGENEEYLSRAIEDLTQAKMHCPRTLGQPRYAIGLARALERAGKDDLAVRELRAAVRHYADSSDAARELVGLLGRQKKYDEQETVIRQQIQLRPKEWVWPHLLGKTAEHRGLPREAERAYRQAAERCGYGAQGVGRGAVDDLLRMLARRSSAREIIDIVEKHIRPGDRDFRTWTYYGAALLRVNRAKEASPAWAAACNAALTSAEQLDIARAMKMLLGPDTAFAVVREMVRSSPRNVRFRFLLAVMLSQAGKQAEAVKLLEQTTPTATQPAERLHLLTYLGTLRMAAQEGELASPLFRQALEIDKDDLTALNNLAYLLAEQLGKPEEALPYARRAAELRPDSADVLDTLGWCLALTGEYQAAVNVLEEALAKQPVPFAFYHLAEAYRRMGKTDQARQMGEKGLLLAKLMKSKLYQEKIEATLKQIRAKTP